MINAIYILNLICKPFYIFWRTLSFGFPNMENRAFGTLCLTLYLNSRTLLNLFVRPHLAEFDANILTCVPLIVFYFLGSSYAIKNLNLSETYNSLNFIGRILNILFVIIYSIFSLFAFLYLGRD